MSLENSRYVAEIDLPEGYLSIECEILYGTENSIKIFINQTSIDKDSYLKEFSSEFKNQLLNETDLELRTKRMDVENFLNEVMLEEFGADADILIRDIDSD